MVPHRIVHAQPDEPAEEQVIVELVASAIYFALMTVCWQGVVPFVVGLTNDTQSGCRIYYDLCARLDVGSYRCSGCRTGARQLEDYLRPCCVVAPHS